MAKWITGLTGFGLLFDHGWIHPILGLLVGAGWVWLLVRFPKPAKVVTLAANQRVVVHRPQRRRYFANVMRPYRPLVRYGTWRAARKVF